MGNQDGALQDPGQLVLLQKKLRLDNRRRAGVNWFFWIAGLSLVNTLIYVSGGSLVFVIGLGATQVVDGLAKALSEEIVQAGLLIKAVGLVVNVIIAAIFALFGFLGRNRKQWAVIAGLVLYALDAILLLAFQDFLGFAFHIIALISIGMAVKANKDLNELEENQSGPAIEVIRQQMMQLETPQVTPGQKRIRLILIGGILLVIAITCVLVSLLQ